MFNASTVPAVDFRVDYLEEARRSLLAANQITTEFWANLLGAIANSNVAAVSDDVACGLLVRQEERGKKNERIRELLDQKLGYR